MNLQFYIEKLKDSDEFQKFMVENPDSYLCSCFFEIGYSEGNFKGNEKQHLDFYSPNSKQIFSFKIEEQFMKEPLENFNGSLPKKLGEEFEFNFEELGRIISERMESEKINKKIQKLLISLQKIEDKDSIVATVFISGLGMLKVIIDPISKNILEFEKKSFFDIIKVTRKKS